MAKKIVQDVLPPERSIRNIPLSNKTSKDTSQTRTRRTSPVSAALNSRTRSSAGARSVAPEEKVRAPKNTGSQAPRSRMVLWSIAVVCFIGVVYAFSFLFVSATVTVTQKQWTLPVNVQLDASKNSDVLPYSLISVTREATRTIPASGEEQVEQKASGLVALFNTQAQPQKLIKNTRLESSSGLIFRITDAVTVPGATTKATSTTPGRVTVKVVADKAGPTYNVGLADFTIPGFKGDPKYKTVFAKSEPSSPLQGGFVGKVGKVKDADLQDSYTAMEKELKEGLLAQVNPQIPAGHVFFPKASVITYEKSPVSATNTASNPATATIKEKAVLTGVLFDKEKLTAALERSFPAEVTKTAVDINNWDALNFVFKNNTDTQFVKGEQIQFTLQGNAIVIAQANRTEIASLLSGKSRSDFTSILEQAPAVAKAELSMKPVWAWTLPKNPEKITVVIAEPL